MIPIAFRHQKQIHGRFIAIPANQRKGFYY